MISRRKFLELGKGAAGIAAVTGSRLAAGSPPLAEDTSLPPSIARLKSRKNEATPITLEERGERQEQARKLMRDNAIDAIVLMAGTSLQYFSRHSLVGR